MSWDKSSRTSSRYSNFNGGYTGIERVVTVETKRWRRFMLGVTIAVVIAFAYHGIRYLGS